MMKINITKYDIIVTLLMLGLGIGGTCVSYYTDTHAPRITSTSQVSASSSLYQSVRRNDLNYLHKIGNRKAELANAQAGIDQTHGEKAHYGGKYPVYHHDKYGNYWSYLEGHSSIMPNDPNIDDDNTNGDRGNANHSNSGVLANEKVLENHGIHSGVNFSYWKDS